MKRYGKSNTSVKRFKDIVNQDYNDFKHGSSDPNQEIEFEPEVIEIFIIDSIHMFYFQEYRLSVEMVMFCLWLYNYKPGVFLESELKQKLSEVSKKVDCDFWGEKFFSHLKLIEDMIESFVRERSSPN
ncbi:hypothetical protein GF362_00915 [Candidatus Dojkabacteria bacterium]|nr:hypothetical protein [Candidatus Dojkabacteria bacterium]